MREDPLTFEPLGVYEIPGECSMADCNDEPVAALAVWPYGGDAPSVAFLCHAHADQLTIAGLRPDAIEHSCGRKMNGARCGAVATHVVVGEDGRHLTISATCRKHLPDSYS